MKLLLVYGLALCLGSGLANGAPAGWRFGLPAQVVDTTNSVAQPGNAQVTLSTNSTLEIVDWRTAVSATNSPGEFVLKLARPLGVGTIVAYEPGEVSFMVSNQWRRLPAGNEEGRKLQILPLPPGEIIEGLKFIVPAKGANTEGRTEFRATLPFVTLLPVRLLNIAADAQVRASSTQAGASPQTLVDGQVDATRNFATKKRDATITPELPEWIELSWKQPQTARGVAFFRGSNDAGRGRGILEAFTSTNSLPSTWTTNGWEIVPGRVTAPGPFRGDEFLVALNRVSTRALRITTTGEVNQVGLGEIVVFRELGTEPAPAKKSAGK